jgi:predicted small lipoprotein YifL
MRHFLIIGLLGSLLALSACGLKGDLYLPPPKSGTSPAAPEPSPAGTPATEEDESTTGPKSEPPPQ